MEVSIPDYLDFLVCCAFAGATTFRCGTVEAGFAWRCCCCCCNLSFFSRSFSSFSRSAAVFVVPRELLFAFPLLDL